MNELKNSLQRVRIATLFQDANKTQTVIANYLNVSPKCVRKWQGKDLTNPKEFIDQPRSGRPPVKKNHYTQKILDTCYNPTFSRRKYSNMHWLSEINISKSWVSQICIENGKFAYKNKLVGLMNDVHKERRLQWGLEMMSYDIDYWENYLITDSKLWRLFERLNRQNQRTTVDKGDLERVRVFEKPKHPHGTIHIMEDYHQRI